MLIRVMMCYCVLGTSIVSGFYWTTAKFVQEMVENGVQMQQVDGNGKLSNVCVNISDSHGLSLSKEAFRFAGTPSSTPRSECASPSLGVHWKDDSDNDSRASLPAAASHLSVIEAVLTRHPGHRTERDAKRQEDPLTVTGLPDVVLLAHSDQKQLIPPVEYFSTYSLGDTCRDVTAVAAFNYDTCSLSLAASSFATIVSIPSIFCDLLKDLEATKHNEDFLDTIAGWICLLLFRFAAQGYSGSHPPRVPTVVPDTLGVYAPLWSTTADARSSADNFQADPTSTLQPRLKRILVRCELDPVGIPDEATRPDESFSKKRPSSPKTALRRIFSELKESEVSAMKDFRPEECLDRASRLLRDTNVTIAKEGWSYMADLNLYDVVDQMLQCSDDIKTLLEQASGESVAIDDDNEHKKVFAELNKHELLVLLDNAGFKSLLPAIAARGTDGKYLLEWNEDENNDLHAIFSRLSDEERMQIRRQIDSWKSEKFIVQYGIFLFSIAALMILY
jgi:hypothetical protein